MVDKLIPLLVAIDEELILFTDTDVGSKIPTKELAIKGISLIFEAFPSSSSLILNIPSCVTCPRNEPIRYASFT